MSELVAALEPTDRAPRRGGWVLAAVALAAAGYFAVAAQRIDEPCAAGPRLAEAAYDAEKADRIDAVLRRHTAEFDPQLGARVVARLDAYRDVWITAHRDTCEATRVLGTQSDSLHDLRMRCLTRRLDGLATLSDALGRVDGADEATRAISAVDALPDPSTCAADRVREPEYAVPDDPAIAQRAGPLRLRISDAWASYHLARYDDALDAAQRIHTDATELGFVPLQAQATYLLGTALGRVARPEEAEATLRRARVLAAEANADELAADISVQLLRTVMFAGAPDRVLDLAAFTRADARRAGRSTAEVDGIVGEAKLHAGDHAAALPPIEAALAEETRPDRRALLLANRASAKLGTGDATGALTDYEAALDVARAHYGGSHPTVGFFEHRVGRGRLAVGDTTGALRTLQAALTRREAALGPDDRAIASVLLDLGRAAAADEQLELARASLLRARSIRRAAYGPTHPSLAEIDDALAQLSDDGE
jgi:tetratricopeptide (TPR) repeat protein